MTRTLFKLATTAGLIGLAVLHPQPFGKLVTAASSSFRKAVSLG